MKVPTMTTTHPRIAVNIAGLASFVTLVVKLVEDAALRHTFDSVDQSTIIAAIVGVVYVLCVVGGVEVDGPSPVPAVVEANSGDQEPVKAAQ